MMLDDLLPVYGRCGTVVAWIDDDVLFDMTGRYVAFFDDATVYSFRGRVLGFYEGGWFRDTRGDAVAFTTDHDDQGPVAPVCDPPPLPPALDCPPHPTTPHVFPVSPVAGVDWSLQTWGEFIADSGPVSSMY